MDRSPDADRRVKRMARVVGVLYLVIFALAPFAFLFGKESILVPGDAVATARSIVDNETLFRLGMATESVVFLVEIVLAALLYVLLRPVSAALSLAAAFARVAEAVVQAVNLLTSVLVLLSLSGVGYLAAFERDQLEALVSLFLDANEFVILIWGLFFGLHLLLLGYLVYRSRFWPKILGVLLLLAGVGYVVEGYGNILSPASEDVLATIVLVLAIPGELVFALYLVIKGVDPVKWSARVRSPVSN